MTNSSHFPVPDSRFRAFSLARIWTLAAATVTQLVRMRILAFLVVFCFIVVAAGFAFPVMNPEQQLKLLKRPQTGKLRRTDFIENNLKHPGSLEPAPPRGKRKDGSAGTARRRRISGASWFFTAFSIGFVRHPLLVGGGKNALFLLGETGT